MPEYATRAYHPLRANLAAALAATGAVRVATDLGGRTMLSASSNVGVLRAGDVELRVTPKLGIRRLLWLVGHAQDQTGWRDDDEVQLAAADDLVSAVAVSFRAAANRALAAGVLQGYRVTDEALPVLRGRLREADQLRGRLGLAVPLEVRYDDYTVDIPENQLLLAAALRLLRVPALPGPTHTGLRRQVALLSDVFLLVEGEHDRLVFGRLLGEKFTELGVDLLPFRGGAQLAHVIDSQFLFMFTDARVIIVLDNLPAEPIGQLWSEVRERLATGDLLGARRPLERLGREGEEGFLKEFGIRAVEESRADRIEVFGLSKRDIICYLPIQAVVPSALSWQEVEARYEKEYPPGSQRQPDHMNFKRWLRSAYGVRITLPVIRAAIDSLDAVPNEFVDLLRLCQYPTLHAPDGRHTASSGSASP